MVVVINHGGQQRTSCQQVLEADVKRGVGVGREDCPLLAGDVLWPAVLVSHGITDLHIGDSRCQHQDISWLSTRNSQQGGHRIVGRVTRATHVHVDPHAISFGPADDRRHNHQCVPGDKVPYASFSFAVV